MKGVILGIAPDARLVDLSHDIAPQDVRQAAYVLSQRRALLPRRHDPPGGGGSRRGQRTAPAVGDDADGMLRRAGQWPVHLRAGSSPARRPGSWIARQFWLPQVSRTFHGRDIFAPVAAHLASGAAAASLGCAHRRSGAPGRDHGPERRDDGAIARPGRPCGSLRQPDHRHPGDWVADGARGACEIARPADRRAQRRPMPTSTPGELAGAGEQRRHGGDRRA